MDTSSRAVSPTLDARTRKAKLFLQQLLPKTPTAKMILYKIQHSRAFSICKNITDRGQLSELGCKNLKLDKKWKRIDLYEKYLDKPTKCANVANANLTASRDGFNHPHLEIITYQSLSNQAYYKQLMLQWRIL